MKALLDNKACVPGSRAAQVSIQSGASSSSGRVQLRQLLTKQVGDADVGAQLLPAQLHQAAQHGIRGSGEPLPYLESLQQAFSQHDLGGIVAHTDTAAAQGARAMGARAYTTGEHVAFAEKPALSTVAHEAAHVIQQRAGVHLPGGIGQRGDPHELHADAVAQRVMQGQSAEDLLAPYGRHSLEPANPSQVQREVGTTQVGAATSKQADRQDIVVIVGRASKTTRENETAQERDEMETWRAAARALSPIVLEGLDVRTALKDLRNVKKPIGKLYIISHLTDEGHISEVDPDGTALVRSMSEQRGFIQDATQGLGNRSPQSIELLSCFGGSNPKMMAQIATAFGAGKIRAPISGTFIGARTLISGEKVLTVRDIAKFSDAQLSKQLKKMDVVKLYDFVPGAPHPLEGEEAQLREMIRLLRQLGRIPLLAYKNAPGEVDAVPYWAAPIESRAPDQEGALLEFLTSSAVVEVTVPIDGAEQSP